LFISRLASHVNGLVMCMTTTKTDKAYGQSTMRKRRYAMPHEIKDVEEFIQLSDRAHYCDIKRVRRAVKLKLRTPGGLYTLKAEPDKAEEVMKKLRCEIREV